MEVTYRKNPSHNYVIPLCEVPEKENYVVQMLCGNNIPGLLPVSVERMNGSSRIRYEITSLQSMQTLFARQGMSGTEVTRVLEGLLEACESTDSYLLNAADIVTDPQMIYMDPETGKTAFCYLPGNASSGQTETDRQPSSGTPCAPLAEFILRHLNHEDRMAVQLGYGFYEAASRENSSTVQAIRALLPGCRPQHNPDAMQNPGMQQNFDSPQNAAAPYRQGTLQNAANAANAAAPYSQDTWQNRAQPQRPGVSHSSAAGSERDERLLTEDEEYLPDPEIKAETFLGDGSEGKKEKRKRSKEQGAKIRKWLLVCLALAALYGVLVYFLRLDLTQMGGLFFLFAAVTWLVYGTVTGRQEKNHNHWAGEAAEEDDEEAFIRQLMSEVYDTQASGGAEYDGSRGDSYTSFGMSAAGLNDPADRFHSTGIPDTERREQLGATRILNAGADVPQVTLMSENSRYPSLKPIGSENLIGKQTERVDLALPRHDAVSRIHAKLECTSDGIFLTDLNSTNGTWLNGRQISERSELHTGDQVSFAGISYRVKIAEQ